VKRISKKFSHFTTTERSLTVKQTAHNVICYAIIWTLLNQ